MIALWVVVIGTNRTTGFSCPRGGRRAGRRHVLLRQSMEGSSEDEESDFDDGGVGQSLRKIRWLPNVKLGKQPFTGPSPTRARRENSYGSAYEKFPGATGNDDRPPGCQNIDILPVLPLQMLTGLDAIVNEPGGYPEHGEEDDDRFPCGVWDDSSNNAMSVMFGGASKYLPHTKSHVLTVAETRYKVLYDDLLRMGNYYGRKKERAIRQNLEEELKSKGDDQSESTRQFDIESLEDPDEKRRFVVTIQNPAEEGVMAEYGLLFQLKDLDEIAAVTSYDIGGDSMTVDEIRSLIQSNLTPDEIASISEGEEDDVMDVLLQSHYEATHDVIGRVKIHRFVNPEVFAEGPDSREYLMAETSIVELVEENDKRDPVLSVAKALQETAKVKADDEISNAVIRIKDELRSVLDGTVEQPQETQRTDSAKKNIHKNEIPLVPQGILVERRSDESLSVEERAIRQSFARLVSLQHEIKEECRFTKASIKTFGLGRVGFWLSAAAWSQFITKRLESAYGEMQVDLQAKLVQFAGLKGSGNKTKSAEGIETLDFDDLPVELQDEYQLMMNRAMDELGPLALERAVNIQCIVQATSYNERLGVLKECVDNERRRLEAKKMLLGLEKDAFERPIMTREDAEAMLERLVTAVSTGSDMVNDETFQ